jgi:hypothetical protein
MGSAVNLIIAVGGGQSPSAKQALKETNERDGDERLPPEQAGLPVLLRAANLMCPPAWPYPAPPHADYIVDAPISGRHAVTILVRTLSPP